MQTGADRETVRRLVEAIESLLREMRGDHRDQWEALDLGVQQVRVLLLLERHEPEGMGVIADHPNIPRSGATVVVDGLVARELVSRFRDEDDRRRVFCELTALGKQEIGLLWLADRRRVGQVAEMLDGEELRAAVDALEILRNAVDESRQRGEYVHSRRSVCELM